MSDPMTMMKWNREQATLRKMKDETDSTVREKMFSSLSAGMKRRVVDEEFDLAQENLWKAFKSDKQELEQVKLARLKELGLAVI